MSDLKILVVGASVAGPTAAYWLAKAGAVVTVIERFPELRKGGQSIDIRTSGVTIMRRMSGMEEVVRARRTQEEGICFVTDSGRKTATIEASGDADQQSLTSEFEIFRGDLAQVIYDLTKNHERIKYHFGEQIESMQQTGSGPIMVRFVNGLPAAEYDLVVACDGAMSRTRAMAYGCGVRDHVKPLNCWAAYFTIPQDILEGSNVAQIWNTVGGRSMGARPDPSRASRVMAMRASPLSDVNAISPFRDALKKGDDATKDFIAKTFGGCGWKTSEILDAMMKTEDFYASEIVQVKPPCFSRGRIVLVGDAGYCPSPLTGAGTTLAITGAYVLAGEVAANMGDLEAGLRAYEERMTPIVKRLQQIPPIIPVAFAPQTAWGIWFRNLIFNLIVWSRILNLLTRLVGGTLGKDQTGIPEYQFSL